MVSIVDTLNVKANFLDRILIMGDLIIGVVENNIKFKDVHNPNGLEDYVSRMIDQYKKKRISHGEVF